MRGYMASHRLAGSELVSASKQTTLWTENDAKKLAIPAPDLEVGKLLKVPGIRLGKPNE